MPWFARQKPSQSLAFGCFLLGTKQVICYLERSSEKRQAPGYRPMVNWAEGIGLHRKYPNIEPSLVEDEEEMLPEKNGLPELQGIT